MYKHLEQVSVNCPRHKVPLIDVDDPQWRGRLKVCPERSCDYNQMVTPSRKQMKLPGLDPGRQSVGIPDIAEKALVRLAVQWGGLHGYEVLEVGQHVHYLKCPVCHGAVRRIACPRCEETFDAQLPSQSTPGTPDTFWGRREWGNWWKGIEAKKNERAPVRVEQERLVSLGYVDLAWSLEMFEAILQSRREAPHR